MFNYTDKISFHPYFTVKNNLGFAVTIIAVLMLTLKEPYILRDPDNFIPADPLATPVHLQPEWYFLFAYAILRSVPNKLRGVIALNISMTILVIIQTNKPSSEEHVALKVVVPAECLTICTVFGRSVVNKAVQDGLI